MVLSQDGMSGMDVKAARLSTCASVHHGVESNSGARKCNEMCPEAAGLSRLDASSSVLQNHPFLVQVVDEMMHHLSWSMPKRILNCSASPGPPPF